MDEDEYKNAVMAAHLAARMLAQHDLTAMIRAIDHADSVGAMRDPTLYRDKHEAMHEDRKMLVAARQLVALVKVEPHA